MKYSRLDNLRKDKKITQKDLAESIGKTREWYTHILKVKKMAVNDLELLSAKLGVTPSYFFEDTYSLNDKISLVEELNPQTTKNMKHLIETQQDLIAMLKEKVAGLEHRLQEYEQPKSKQHA